MTTAEESAELESYVHPKQRRTIHKVERIILWAASAIVDHYFGQLGFPDSAIYS